MKKPEYETTITTGTTMPERNPGICKACNGDGWVLVGLTLTSRRPVDTSSAPCGQCRGTGFDERWEGEG